MSIYVLITYVEECKKVGINPTQNGLFRFKSTWINI